MALGNAHLRRGRRRRTAPVSQRRLVATAPSNGCAASGGRHSSTARSVRGDEDCPLERRDGASCVVCQCRIRGLRGRAAPGRCHRALYDVYRKYPFSQLRTIGRTAIAARRQHRRCESASTARICGHRARGTDTRTDARDTRDTDTASIRNGTRQGPALARGRAQLRTADPASPAQYGTLAGWWLLRPLRSPRPR